MKVEKLVAAAKELNKVLGINPPIDIEAEETLEASIKESSDLINVKKDVLTESTWAVLEAVAGIKRPAVKGSKAPAAPAKGEGKAPAKAPAAPAKKEGKAVAKVKGEKKPGVIATIFAMLQKGPVTIDKMQAELVKKFPDRSAESMLATIRVQVPGRLAKDKGVKIVKTEKGYKIG